MSWIDKINIDLDGLAFVDETRANVGSSAFKLDHDWFTKEDLEIRTAAGGGGTLLVEGTDYVLVNEDTDLSARATVAYGATRTVYEQIQITNVTYQTGTLYFSGDYIADTIDADDINEVTTLCQHKFTLQEAAAAGDIVVQRGSAGQYISHTVSTPTVLGSALNDCSGVTVLSSSLLVAFFEDAGTVTVRAATIAADLSLTFGNSPTFAATQTSGWMRIKRLSSTSFVIVWDDATDVQAIVGTVSGNTITLGAATQLTTGDARNIPDVAILSSTKFVVVFANTSGANNVSAVVSTITGTTISPGTLYNNGFACNSFVGVCKLGTDEFYIVWRDTTTTLRHQPATVAGTVVTFQAQNTFTVPAGSTIGFHFVFRVNDDHAILFFGTVGGAEAFYFAPARRAGVSTEMTISPGDYVQIDQGDVGLAAAEKGWWAAFDGNVGALYKAANISDAYGLTMLLFTASKEGITFGSRVLLERDSGVNAFTGMGYTISIQDGIIARSAFDNVNNYATVQALQVPIVLGIADGAGTTPYTLLSGYSDQFTGLIPGLEYFLSPTGELLTTEPLKGSRVGRAISTTELIR